MNRQQYEEVTRMLQVLLKKYAQDKETAAILDRIAAVTLLPIFEAPEQKPTET